MRGAGLEFDIAVSGVDEDAIKARHGGTPDALALKLAEAKARDCASWLSERIKYWSATGFCSTNPKTWTKHART